MRIQNLVSPPETFDFTESFRDCTAEDVVVVDVGGGLGQALEEIQDRNPKLKGKLILQDLAGPVNNAKEQLAKRNIDAQVHDFFTQQPIKGTFSS